MKDYQIKVVQVNPWGWRRIAKNFCRFGWELSEAEKQTTTSTEHYVDSDGNIKEKKSSSSKVMLTFIRYPAKFNSNNLLKAMPIEAIYNICFLVRKIAAWVLPILVAFCIGAFFFQAEAIFEELLLTPTTIAGVAWVAMIAAETVLARVGEAILFGNDQ